MPQDCKLVEFLPCEFHLLKQTVRLMTPKQREKEPRKCPGFLQGAGGLTLSIFRKRRSEDDLTAVKRLLSPAHGSVHARSCLLRMHPDFQKQE